MSKVIIEAAVNGMNKRHNNPNIPYRNREIVEAALDACDAGAAILHYHVLGPDNQWSNSIMGK